MTDAHLIVQIICTWIINELITSVINLMIVAIDYLNIKICAAKNCLTRTNINVSNLINLRFRNCYYGAKISKNGSVGSWQAGTGLSPEKQIDNPTCYRRSTTANSRSSNCLLLQDPARSATLIYLFPLLFLVIYILKHINTKLLQISSLNEI